jgi:hypothetical protein
VETRYGSHEKVKREQVGVSGNDVCGVPCHREFQKFVVPGIPADGYAFVHVDPLPLTYQCGQKRSDIPSSK